MDRPRLLALAACVALLICACGAPAAVAPTASPAPTTTIPPAPTDAPTAVPPTAAPTAPLDPEAEREARYLALAQAGLVTPIVRPGLPAGEWKASSFLPGEVQITMPLSVGGDNAQTVRLGKILIAQVVKALFDGAPELARVNVIGTTPGNAAQGELAGISTVVERDVYTRWDGTAENLGPWQVSGRLQ